MKKLYLSLIAFIFSGILFNTAYAQPQEGEFINASIGIGLCSSYDEAEALGEGFYAQAEYVISLNRWFGVRPYAGFVIASGESGEQELERWNIKSNAALLGAKVRLAAPIPYVAPFIETGVGLSVGSFVTNTAYTNIKKNGALLHIPLSFGLAIGRKHNYEVKFTYYYHNSAEQFSGAAAVGFSFPINDE